MAARCAPLHALSVARPSLPCLTGEFRVAIGSIVWCLGPRATMEVEEGGSMELEAKATARRAFSYQWLHTGLPLAAAASAHLHVTSAALQHCGEYVCTASNRWGSARTHPARVIVHEAGGELRFTQHPR